MRRSEDVSKCFVEEVAKTLITRLSVKYARKR